MDAPKHILEWLAVNEPDMRHPVVDMLKCPTCGGWFDGIDHLAPYHWETCWCAKCQTHPLAGDDSQP